MKDIIELKKGDRLYCLSYYKSGREMQVVIVKKATKRYIKLMGGYEWNVTAAMYNKDFFPTKKECYEKALKSHQFQLGVFTEQSNELRQEIRYLNKKVKDK